MGIVCDSNIILDLLLQREPYWSDAACVLNTCEQYDEEVFVSASSITDIYYISHNHNHSKSKSLGVVKEIMKLCSICEVNQDDIINATEMAGRDFEDCVLAAAAIRQECKCIVTRNKKDFKDFGIKVCTPKEFLDAYPQDWK